MTNREEYVFGIRPVIEALNAGKHVEKILIRKGLQTDGLQELNELIVKHKIHSQRVPEEKLNYITRKNHQGVIAMMALIEYQDIGEILTRLFEAGKDPFILMLDRITDVRNLGAIARTAEFAGVDALVIPEINSARINADAIKTSAGALHSIPVCRSANLFKTAVSMLEQGLYMVSASEKGKTLYHEATLTGPICVIMGSEEDGVSAPLLKMSNKLVKIPQYGVISSLNVSVATGIILFEAAKQRSAL